MFKEEENRINKRIIEQTPIPGSLDANFDAKEASSQDDNLQYDPVQKTQKKGKEKLLLIAGVVAILVAMFLNYGGVSAIQKLFAPKEAPVDIAALGTMDDKFAKIQEEGDDFFKQAGGISDEAATNEIGDDPLAMLEGTAPITPAKSAQAPKPAAPAAPNTNKNTDNSTLVVFEGEQKAQNKPQRPKEVAMQDEIVAVQVSNGGRRDPFMPYREKSMLNRSTAPTFELIAPPYELIEDTQAQGLMKTTISGIMFDSKSPSAIINVDDTDYLVRKGDKLKNFVVLDITKDKVSVKQGSNVYKASVGQTLEDTGIIINEVANLNSKFGGSNTSVKSNKKVIEINIK